MLFLRLAETSQLLAATASRSAKIALAADLLGELRGADATEVVTVLSVLSGTLRQRRTGIGYAAAHLLPPASTTATLTVAQVDAAFGAAAEVTGPGAAAERTRLWTQLLSAATGAEQSLLVGLVTGGVRQGAAVGVLLAAVAAAGAVPLDAVRRAVTRGGDVTAVAAAVLVSGAAALADFDATPGRGLSPMLAGSAPDMTTALERTGPANVDWKLDGVRAQAHVLPAQGGLTARIFTRSLDDITERVPAVAANLVALGSTVILDGELLLFGPRAVPRPFQATASLVARQGPRTSADVTFVAFDLLHIDGEDLLDRSLTDRRAALDRLIPTGLLAATVADLPGSLVTVPVLPCPGGSLDEPAARSFADDALSQGHEGVVVKAQDSTYTSGRRGAAWVKVKPRETLDLVVLAVEWGSGRRQGRLSNLHLGARDPAGTYGPPGGFVMLGKTFKGLTDRMLEWQTAKLWSLATLRGEWQVDVRPELVVEIAFDGVQTSPRYPAGVALRFARVLRHREDKPADQADTIDAVTAIHRRSASDPPTGNGS